jgi:hypothetical protein
MKRMIFMIAILFFAVSCETPPRVEFDGKVHFKIDVEDGKNTDQLDCVVGVTTEEGVKLDSDCVGYYEKDGKTVRCSVSIGSDGKPVKEKLDIKTDCEILISKE